MVGYSKQWCELWDQSKAYDFDIDKITKELYRGNYYPIKCEGFGFLCLRLVVFGVCRVQSMQLLLYLLLC